MSRTCGIALGLLLTCTLALAVGAAGPVMAQTKPEGELKFALYVTISPQWFDPGEVTGSSRRSGSCTRCTTRS